MKSSSVPSSVVLVAGAAAVALTLSGCGGASDTSTTTTSSMVQLLPSTTGTPAARACPTAAPEDGGTPQWTLAGATGDVAVTGPTETAAPRVDVGAPFSVTETQVHTLQAGDGPVVAATDTVSVCYLGVNGRDGSVFDSTYQRGTPIDFSLERVVPGFQKAIAGQHVGSSVAVAMTSADGYPSGQPAAGIQPGDTLIFAIKILDTSN